VVSEMIEWLKRRKTNDFSHISRQYNSIRFPIFLICTRARRFCTASDRGNFRENWFRLCSDSKPQQCGSPVIRSLPFFPLITNVFSFLKHLGMLEDHCIFIVIFFSLYYHRMIVNRLLNSYPPVTSFIEPKKQYSNSVTNNA